MSSDLQSRAALLTANDPVDFGNLHPYKDEEEDFTSLGPTRSDRRETGLYQGVHRAG